MERGISEAARMGSCKAIVSGEQPQLDSHRTEKSELERRVKGELSNRLGRDNRFLVRRLEFPREGEVLVRIRAGAIAAADVAAPASKSDGDPFDVVFINRPEVAVNLFWLDTQGQPKPNGSIAAGKRKRQSTRPGAVWLITDDADKPLGHFVVDDRTAQAIIRPD